jgi:hypothetical protein
VNSLCGGGERDGGSPVRLRLYSRHFFHDRQKRCEGCRTTWRPEEKTTVLGIIPGLKSGERVIFITKLIIGRYIPPREGGVQPMAKDQKPQEKKQEKPQEKGKKK